MSKVITTLFVALVLLAPARAWAIAVRAPCETPFVFSDAALNVVVLPYTQAASLPLPAGGERIGQQLSGLVELEALMAVMKYRSIGLVQLEGDARCTAEAVLDKLLGKTPGARVQVKPGRAIILVWGRIFQSGQDLYLQSYLQFLRRNEVERITVSVDGRPLSGRLSSQALGCPPRKVTLADLEAIQKQFAGANLLRVSPDPNASFVPIPDGGGPFSFWITDVRGDWVQLQAMAQAGEKLPLGWVRARADDPQWSLRRRMPELGLIDGIGGYLAARATPTGSRPMFDAADAALAQYLDRWKDGALLAADDAAGSGMRLAVAIPAQLRGFIALLRGEPSTATLTAAGAQFTRAMTVLPFSGDARNLAAMTRLALAARAPQPEQSARPVVDDLLAAVSTEPDNRDVLTNLGAVYDLVLTPKRGASVKWVVSGGDREEFERQRNAIRLLLRPR